MEHNCLWSSEIVLHPWEPGAGRCENPPVLHFQGVLMVIPVCGQCPGEGMSPPQPGGHTWVLWLTCPGANLFCSVPPVSLCCELGRNVPRLTDFYCLHFWLVLLKKIIKDDPHRGLIFGTISVVSCCRQHLLEKGFQTGYLRTLLLKTFQFYFYFSFPSCQR